VFAVRQHSRCRGPWPQWWILGQISAGLNPHSFRKSQYARLHLNQWTQSEDRLVSWADLEAAAVLDGELEARPGVQYLISVDLGLVNDKTVVAVAHTESISEEPGAARRVVVDSIRRWRGSKKESVKIDDVEAYLVLTSKRYNNAKILADPWQAAGMIQRLQAQAVRCEPFNFTTTSVGRIGQSLHLALRNHLLWLPNDPDLLSELARVRLRETGIGQARLDHDSGDHDDQAVAIAILTAELIGNAKGPGAKEWLEQLGREQIAVGGPPMPGSVDTPSDPAPWDAWAPLSREVHNPQYEATMRMLQDAQRGDYLKSL
jgi:phage terminase large subunit-like protein